MKKSKKFLVLAAATASLLSLAGCNEVIAKKNVLIEFRNANGNYTQYTADDLFAKYTESTQKSTESYYNAIYNVLVEEWFNLGENSNLKKECDTAADIAMEAKKSEADSASDSNKTTYDEEWEKILNTELSDMAEDKRDDKQLLHKFQLNEYKTKLGDEFYDKFKTWAKENVSADEQTNNLFWGDQGYLKEKLPYHVKHILVNVDADNADYYKGTVSSANVSKLYTVVSELAAKEDFGEIARDQSDDEGSAKSFGDLGIMDTSTGYVNEFKLGIYAYDTYFNTSKEVGSSLSKNANPFNIPENDANYVKSLGIASIPYGAVVQMNNLKDTTLDQYNKEVNDNDSAYYPRNILFNKYFNNHNLGFITPESLSGKDPVQKFADDNLNAHYTDLNEDGTWTNGPVVDAYANMEGFQSVTLNTYDAKGNKVGTVTRKVLCDNNGNPILVVRAGSGYQGIHFIVVTRSALEENKEYTANGEVYNVALNEYYCSENPLTSSSQLNKDFPTTTKGTQKKTYVNTFINSYDKYNERVNDIKSKVKDFDTNYEYRIYTWLKGQLSVKFNSINGINMEERINNFIESKRNSTKNDTRVNNIETWDNFIEQLQVQQSQRQTKLIPETCALHFKEGFKNNPDQTVVEACYREK